MARSSDLSGGGDAARRYRSAQLGLARLLLRDMRVARRLIVPGRMTGSVTDWVAAVRAIVQHHAATSAQLGVEFFLHTRQEARVPGRVEVPEVEAPPDSQVDNSLRWATKDLWPRDPAAESEAQARPIGQRLEAAEAKAEGAAQKLVADAGRRQVVEAVRADPRAVGWYRVSALDACAFCRLMSSRGGIYRSRGSAGADANEQFTGSGDFKFHDHCGCLAAPIYEGQVFRLGPQAQRWADIYARYAQGRGGQLSRFREAIAAFDAGTLDGFT